MEFILLANAALFVGLYASDLMSGDQAEDLGADEDSDEYLSGEEFTVSSDLLIEEDSQLASDRETLAMFLNESDGLAEFGQSSVIGDGTLWMTEEDELGDGDDEASLDWLSGNDASSAGDVPFDEADAWMFAGDEEFEPFEDTQSAVPHITLEAFVSGEHVMELILPPEIDPSLTGETEAELTISQMDMGVTRISLNNVVIADIETDLELTARDFELISASQIDTSDWGDLINVAGNGNETDLADLEQPSAETAQDVPAIDGWIKDETQIVLDYEQMFDENGVALSPNLTLVDDADSGYRTIMLDGYPVARVPSDLDLQLDDIVLQARA